MRPRTFPWAITVDRRSATAALVWSLAAAAALLGLGSAVAAFAHAIGTGETRRLLSHQSLQPVVTVAFAALGALIVTRHRRNTVGWLLLVVAVLSSLSLLAVTSSVVAPPLGPSWRLGDVRAWLAWADLWLWIPALFLPTTFLFLYFPDGRLPSRSWRPVAWSAWVALLAMTAGIALHPGPLSTWSNAVNPWGVRAAAPVLGLLVTVAGTALTAAILASILALVMRFRRARDHVREQMAWMVYAAVLLLVSVALAAVLSFSWPNSALATEAAMGLPSLGTLAVAVAAAIAILRHRLYGIDLIIQRTLVYSALSAMVVTIYVVLVGAGVMATREDPRLAAVPVTAALAVLLFRPARRRAQRFADRITNGSPALSPAAVPGALHATAPANAIAQASASAPAPAQAMSPPRGPPPVSAQDPEAASDPTSRAPTRLHSLARRPWPVAAAASLALLVLAVPGYLARRPLGILGGQLAYAPTPGMLVIHRLNLVGSVLVVLASLALAWVVYRNRRHDAAMSLFLAYFMLAHPLVMGGVIEMLEPLWPTAPVVNAFVLSPGLFAPLTFALVSLFPSGRFEPPWTRWSTLAAAVAGALTFPLLVAARFDIAAAAGTPAGSALGLALGISGVTVAYGLRIRYRGAGAVARRQIKWLVYGYVLTVALVAISSIPWIRALTLPAGTAMPWWVPLTETLWLGAVAVIPVTLTLSILRLRLFEIDLLINRTLVFGSLTGLVLALYVVVVGAAGSMLQARENLLVTLLATGVVAALFQPLRERLQRGVNRLVYGDRDDPYAVLSGLGRRLEAVQAPAALLPTVAETVAQALKLPYVAVSLRYAGGDETVASFGRPVGSATAFPLMYQGETIGELLVAPRPGEATLRGRDRSLLEAIARQASVAAHGVRLTTELRRSRERLVSAREEERRRLRRDLHDGLGPLLASMSLRVDTARNYLEPGHRRLDATLEGLAEQLDVAVADIRRLVYGLRPPALDELGLVGALREQARQYEGPKLIVEVRAADLPPLPAAAEVAAYRIAQEALTNVVRHAQAGRCVITLAVADGLDLTIDDDGKGLPGARSAGVGLRSMVERASELGGSVRFEGAALGGLRVRARLPLIGGSA